jgi:uncharacterized membrane protein YphA (DoxX/SURF4 family)
MDLALWIAQGLLALIFLGAAVTKLKDDRLTYAATRPPNTSYAEDLSDPLFKTIGVLELLASLGLVLPWALGIAPALTPLAAAGLAVVMVGAIVVHRRRGESGPIVVNLVLLVLCVVVAVGRGAELLG